MIKRKRMLTAERALPMAASVGEGACSSLRPEGGGATPWHTKASPLTSMVKLPGPAGMSLLAATQPKASGTPPDGRGPGVTGVAGGPEYGWVANKQ